MRDDSKYSRDLQKKMRNWRFDLDKLKAHGADGDVEKEELGEIFAELEDHFSVLEERFRDYQHSPGAARDGMREAVERAWEEASYAIDHAKSILLH